MMLTHFPGAFFGTTFAPLFFESYPELLSTPFYAPPASSSTANPSPALSATSSPPPVGGETITNPNPNGGQKASLGKTYIPRIYGFKVSERSRSGPRMKWLRERPERYSDLDLVDNKGRWKDAEGGGSGAAGGEDAGGKGEPKRGALFDDEDDGEDDDEEEEEEDDAKAAPTATTTAAPAQPRATGQARAGR
jgi:casein kinase II subunit beta